MSFSFYDCQVDSCRGGKPHYHRPTESFRHRKCVHQYGDVCSSTLYRHRFPSAGPYSTRILHHHQKESAIFLVVLLEILVDCFWSCKLVSIFIQQKCYGIFYIFFSSGAMQFHKDFLRCFLI